MKTVDIYGKEYKSIPGFPEAFISEDGELLINGLICITKSFDTNDYCHYHHGIANLTHLRHRLVAMAWKELPDNWESMDVNHINGRPGDDWSDNLEWCTRSENINHSIDIGQYGSDTIYVKIGVDGIIGEYNSLNRAAKAIGVSSSTISIRLDQEQTIVMNDNIFITRSSKAISDWVSYTPQQKIRFGTPVLIDRTTDNIVHRSNSFRLWKAQDILPLSAPTILSHLAYSGSNITETRAIKFDIAGELHEVDPWLLKSELYKVYIMDLDEGELHTFDTVAEAASKLRLDRSNLSDKLKRPGFVINGRYKVGNDPTFTDPFVPKSDRESIAMEDKISLGFIVPFIPVWMYNVLTNSWESYPSIREASRITGCTRSSIKSARNRNNLLPISPKYRVAPVRRRNIPELSYSDLRRIGKPILRTKDDMLETKFGSMRELGRYLGENDIASETGIRRYPNSIIRKLYSENYELLFSIEDVIYEISENGDTIEVNRKISQ